MSQLLWCRNCQRFVRTLALSAATTIPQTYLCSRCGTVVLPLTANRIK